MMHRCSQTTAVHEQTLANAIQTKQLLMIRLGVMMKPNQFKITEA